MDKEVVFSDNKPWRVSMFVIYSLFVENVFRKIGDLFVRRGGVRHI